MKKLKLVGAIGCFIASGIFLLGFIAGLTVAKPSFFLGETSTTIGEITNFSAQWGTVSKSVMYVNCRYTFEVDGETYTGIGYTHPRSQSSNGMKWGLGLKEYSPGDKVTVIYSVEDPKRAIIHNVPQLYMHLWIIPSILLVVLGIFLSRKRDSN